MFSKIEVNRCNGKLTEDEWDDDGLDVLCAGFIGVSRKIGDIQA